MGVEWPALVTAAAAVPVSLVAVLAAAPRPSRLQWFELHWPRDLPTELGASVLRQLAADRRAGLIALEAEGSKGLVRYRLGVREDAAERVTELLRSIVPEMAVTAASERTLPKHAWRVTLSSRHRTLRHDDPTAVVRGLLAGLAATRADEVISWQLILGKRHLPRPVATDTPAVEVEPWWHSLVTGRDKRLESERRAALQIKRREHGLGAVIRVGIDAGTAARRRALLAGFVAGLRAAEAPGIHVSLRADKPSRLDQAAAPPWFLPLVLNVAELAGLTGWPFGDQSLPGVPRTGPRWQRPDQRLVRSDRVIAKATAPGPEQLLGLSVGDARQHLHLIGPTGTGKSTLLLNLALADMKAGLGVVVIDPKGDLITDLLERAPLGRQSDIVVLDPTDAARPVGLNPLATGGRNPELVADQVLSVFHSLWESSWGPRTSDILHASLLSLAGRTETTLCALPILLTNRAVRRHLLAGMDDPIALGPFWDWYEGLKDGERQAVIAPIMNKLRAFLLRPRVRGVLGQIEPRFQVEHVFSRHKILLVSLAKGLLGPEASALLGSLVVAQLWNGALAQAAVPSPARKTVGLYIDEFQDYLRLPTDLADALAQARGLGVAMTLAHQHLGQLPPEMRAAVLANARSRVCFQMSAEDARVMARRAGGLLTDDDFQQLGRYEVYVQLVAEGEVTSYASGRTLPPGPVTGNAARVRSMSRERYGRPLEEIEAEIRQLLELAQVPEDHPGRRSRRRA